MGERGVGSLDQLSLADLVHLLHVGRKTGCLEIEHRDPLHGMQEGAIWVREGEIVDARAQVFTTFFSPDAFMSSTLRRSLSSMYSPNGATTDSPRPTTVLDGGAPANSLRSRAGPPYKSTDSLNRGSPNPWRCTLAGSPCSSPSQSSSA